MATEIKPPIKYDMVWTMYGKRADFFGIAERFHIDPVTARVIRNRDVITDEEIDTYLNGGLDRLHDPAMMKNMRSCLKKSLRVFLKGWTVWVRYL